MLIQGLYKYAERPIPGLHADRFARERANAIPIDTSHVLFPEKAASLHGGGRVAYARNHYYIVQGEEPFNPPYYSGRISGSTPHLWLRQTPANLLAVADRMLRVFGFGLRVYDAYRPIEVQGYLWQRALSDVKLGPLDEMAREASRFRVPGLKPDGTVNKDFPPPHLTGGAVDLSIRHVSSGELVFMGAIFDENGDAARTEYFEKKLAEGKGLSHSESEALDWRRVLYRLLTDLGFRNNPDKFWHWSWGDQEWAAMYGSPVAFYGEMHVPPFDQPPYCEIGC